MRTMGICMMGNKLIGMSLANQKQKDRQAMCIYANKLRKCFVVVLFATRSEDLQRHSKVFVSILKHL